VTDPASSSARQSLPLGLADTQSYSNHPDPYAHLGASDRLPAKDGEKKNPKKRLPQENVYKIHEVECALQIAHASVQKLAGKKTGGGYSD
jgi:hypothetical protein